MRNEENLVGSVLFILGVAALGYAMHLCRMQSLRKLLIGRLIERHIRLYSLPP